MNSTLARLAAVPATAVIVLIGVWITGGLVTDDESTAKVLTGGWFAAAGGLALLIAVRWRSLLVPVLATWLVTSGAAGGYLLATSTLDRVADEQVTVAAPRPTATGDADTKASAWPESTGTTAPAKPVAVAAGEFKDGAHPTSGTATLIERPDGTRVLTLTGFTTDPGPDLRVFLTPDRKGKDYDDAADLGGLKGNKGDQEYAVPSGTRSGAVVIWCRAFSVAFGTASLRA